MSTVVALWRPDNDSEINTQYRSSQKTIFFHIAAVMDQNKCELEFRDLSVIARSLCSKALYKAVAQGSVELNGNSIKVEFSESGLELMYGLFHRRMKENIQKLKRKNPYDLYYQITCNVDPAVVGFALFSQVFKAVFSLQA